MKKWTMSVDHHDIRNGDTIEDVTMEGCTFEGLILSDVTFKNCNFLNCQKGFIEILFRSKFDSCNFDNCCMQEETGWSDIELENCVLLNTKFRKPNYFTNISFKKTSLGSVSFSGLDIDTTSILRFHQCKHQWSSFKDSCIDNIVFNRNYLINTEFENSFLTRLEMKICRLYRCILGINTDIDKAIFDRVDFYGGAFNKLNFGEEVKVRKTFLIDTKVNECKAPDSIAARFLVKPKREWSDDTDAKLDIDASDKFYGVGAKRAIPLPPASVNKQVENTSAATNTTTNATTTTKNKSKEKKDKNKYKGFLFLSEELK